jgi:hypothetical protein
VRFDDCSSPAEATWEDVSSLPMSAYSGDPILAVDHLPGTAPDRCFVSQLADATTIMSTSDDGDMWMPSEGSSPASRSTA